MKCFWSKRPWADGGRIPRESSYIIIIDLFGRQQVDGHPGDEDFDCWSNSKTYNHVRGYVNVYELVEIAYVQLSYSWFIIDDTSWGQFGRSLSLFQHENTLAIGSPHSGNDSGYAKVYERDEATLNYQQLGKSFVGQSTSVFLGRS